MPTNIAPLDGLYQLDSADVRFPDAVVFPGTFLPGNAPPSDTRYGWQDTNYSPSIAKIYDETLSIWAGINGSTGSAANVWCPIIASFTAGAVGTNSLVCHVSQQQWFAVGNIVQLFDPTTTVVAVYQVTAWSGSDELILTRLSGGLPTASAAYVFTVPNACTITITGWPGTGGGGFGSYSLLVDSLGDQVTDSSGNPIQVFT